VSVILGSKNEVERVTRYHTDKWLELTRDGGPLCGPFLCPKGFENPLDRLWFFIDIYFSEDDIVAMTYRNFF
jgi:hypothetical protein